MMKDIHVQLLVLLAMVLLIASPAFAAKGAPAIGEPQISGREVLDRADLQTLDTSPPYVRPAASGALVPIPPGTYTVGASGVYPTLSAAVRDLQTNGVAGGGAVIFEFIDAAYSDTGQTIGGYPGQGPGAEVIFRPATGVTPTITFTGGGSASNTFCIRLDSAAYVTWDGFNGTTQRALKIQADTATTVNRAAFLIRRTSHNILLTSMTLLSNRRLLSQGGNVVNIVNGTATAAQHDITVDNCWLYRGDVGIAATGTSTAQLDYNLFFTNNLLGGGGVGLTSYLDNLRGSVGAISLQRVADVTIHANDIYGVYRGFAGLGGSAGSVYGLLVLGAASNVTFTKNRMHDIVGGEGAAAVRMMAVQGAEGTAPAVPTTITAANNMFYDCHNFGLGSGGRSVEGFIIFATGGTPGSNGMSLRLINNTFWFRTGMAEATSGTLFMFDLNSFGGTVAAGNPDTLILRNNIAATDRDTNFTRMFLIFEPTEATNFHVVADNNLYAQTDAGAFGQYPTPWPLGASSVNAAFSDWQTITGNDPAGRQGNPEFVSATDAHINTAPGAVSAADSLAAPYAGITDDIDGEVRNAVRPDAGADEFDVTRFVDDLAAQSIDSPLPTQVLKAGAPFVPLGTFFNPGSTTYAAAPVVCEILDSLNVVVYTGPTTLAIGGYSNTAQATFPAVPGLVAGEYTIRIIAAVPGDSRPGNDTVTGSIVVQDAITITNASPYFEDFEGGMGGWMTAAEPGSSNDWVLGTPAKTQISGAWSGTNAWVTKITGNHSDNQESYVFAPVADLSGFTGLLLVEFYSNFKTEFEWDGADLQISLDGGVTWSRIDSTLGTGGNFSTALSQAWYNAGTGLGNITPPYWGGGEGGGVSSAGYSSASAGYVHSSTLVSGVAGLADVRFRWHFSADGATNSEGWAIDDVGFRAISTNDIGILSFGIPGYVGGPVPSDAQVADMSREGEVLRGRRTTEGRIPHGAVPANAPVNLEAQIQNLGANAQPAYTVVWDVDGAPETPVAGPDTLEFGEVDTLTLTWAAGTTGFHTATAVTQLVGDEVAANDTATFAFEVLAPEVLFYEGFNGDVFPPAGWDTLNQDGNVGSVTSWYRSVGYPYEGAGSARANFNGANGFFIDEWLITPNTGGVPDTAVQVDSLSFWASNFPNSIYPESLMVMVSTSTTHPDSFTLVLGYFEVPSDNYTKFTFVLPDAANRYIAFRRLLYDGGPNGSNSDNLFLDDVRITRYDSLSTGVGGLIGSGALPKEYALGQNYPNPFNPSTTIGYELPEASIVKLSVYDILGRQVRILVDGVQEAGVHSAAFNVAGLASGVYVYRLEAVGAAGPGRTFTQTRTMLLLK